MHQFLKHTHGNSYSKEIPMQCIYLLSTGGTIEKVYSEQGGAVVNRAAKLDRYLQGLRLPDVEIRSIQLMNKDSLEMTDADRAEIRDRVAVLLPEGFPIVISHGTDTMVETGLFLERAFPELKVPMIMTGAMTPLGFEGSDALQNLTESLFAARLLSPGVFVVMHGQVFPISHVRKDKDKATFVWK
jgi:L-asparaginase